MIQLYACSTNAGKIREFALAVGEFGIEDFSVEVLPGLKNILAPVETGSSFEENAALKATYYSQFTDALVFADDSGLEVYSLDGAPGIYSARFAGLDATDPANNELLLQRLQNDAERGARFVCALTIAQKRKVLHSVRATVEGEILTAPRGSNGFGYDPLFFYPPLNRSLAELSLEEKFQVSHRGKAIRELLHWLAQREGNSAQ